MIQANGLVVEVSSSEFGGLGSIPDECWNSLPRLGHFAAESQFFARHWARQCTDTSTFYIAHNCWALYNFLFLDFVSGDLAQRHADTVVNLNTTTRLPLFWRTWTLARASTCPHASVRAWHIGRDYSDCRGSELTDRQVSGFIYSWFLGKYKKTKASKEIFLRLMPRTDFHCFGALGVRPGPGSGLEHMCWPDTWAWL